MIKHSKVSLIPDSGDNNLVEPSDWNADHVLTGTIPIANGGTGTTTANDAFNALVPSQTGNTGKYLTTDGSNTSWAVNPLGTVTSVATGTGLTGGPITTSGTISFSNSSVATWAETPSSANLASAMTDETGTGNLVFNTSPLLLTPTISGGTVDNAQPYLNFASTTPPTYTAGRVWYDTSSSSIAYYNNTTNNIVHTGQEVQQEVRNSTGVTITKGSVCYISGQTGQIANITLGQANTLGASNVVGLANQDIPNNTNGYLVILGQITNFDTSAFTAGDTLYLSATTPGAITNVAPTSPNYAIRVGFCIYSNNSNGKIFVSVRNAYVATNNIVGQVPLANGGTNANLTASAGSITYSTASALALSTIGTSGQVLTSQGASAPTWTTPTTGTVTSVSGTSPISVATGTTTPAISISQATTSTNGYLSSADWNTFNNKQPSGTYVNSVSGTAGRITSSGGVTPIIDLASGVAIAGTTGSSTLIPVITIDTYGRVTTITTASNPQGTVTSVSGTGTVSGITLTGTVTSSGSLTLGGTLDLSSPPAIGGTVANTINGTTITGTKFVGISGGTF